MHAHVQFELSSHPMAPRLFFIFNFCLENTKQNSIQKGNIQPLTVFFGKIMWVLAKLTTYGTTSIKITILVRCVMGVKKAWMKLICY